MILASIERITNVKHHPNADKLDQGLVKAWPVVIGRDIHKENELVVFIYPDVLIDKNNPVFSFMEKRKWRVWQMKLRGERSCGLVMPVSILNDYTKDINIVEGMDVGEIIKCEKYERPLPAELAGQVKGSFPTHIISKTDEDNYLSNPEVEHEFRGKECYVTLKMDGSSLTIVVNKDDEWVCSRNLALKESETNAFWKIVKKYDLINKIRSIGNIAIQGELCGEGIQSNKLKIVGTDFYMFNAKDIDTGIPYNMEQLKELAEKLEIKMVPIVKEFLYDDSWSISRLQELADEQKYRNDPAEGIVIRPKIPVFSPTLSKCLSVKIINSNY